MLKRKLKECKGCGRKKPIWKDEKCVDCCKPTYGGLKSTTPLKKGKTGKSKEVVDFFKKQTTGSGRSVESGTYIPNLGAVNIAHLLPKTDFPKFATDPNNVVILTWQEHTRFDELLGRHEFDKIREEMPNTWKILQERFIDMNLKIESPNKLSRALEKYIYDL